MTSPDTSISEIKKRLLECMSEQTNQATPTDWGRLVSHAMYVVKAFRGKLTLTSSPSDSSLLEPFPDADHEMAKVKSTRRNRFPLHSRHIPLVAGAVTVVLCLVVAAVILQERAPSADTERAASKMLDGLVNFCVDEKNATQAPQQPFQLPASSSITGAAPANASQAESAVQKDGKNVSSARAAVEMEFLLAQRKETLPELEQLIWQYIAKGKYRRARDLAGAGFRSPVATAEDRQRFFSLYRQCLGRC